MNEQMIETGYHATSKECADLILATNYKKSISTIQKKHWLGNGVYFFNDICWAVQWNINELKKEENSKKRIKDFNILKSKIVADEEYVLDLSSMFGKEVLKYMKEQLKEKLISAGKEEMIEDLKKRSLKFLINMLDDYGLLDEFYVVKATYVEKREAKKLRYSDDFLMKIQCQICVRNIQCIKETQRYENEYRLNEIYNFLKK